MPRPYSILQMQFVLRARGTLPAAMLRLPVLEPQVISWLERRSPEYDGNAVLRFTHETATGQQARVLSHEQSDARSSAAIQDFCEEIFVDAGRPAIRTSAAIAPARERT